MSNWQLWFSPIPARGGKIKCEIIPDGSVDLVFEVINKRQVIPYVFGTSLSMYEFNTKTDAEYIGIRFRPGVLPLFDDYHASDLVGSHVNLGHNTKLLKFGESLLQEDPTRTKKEIVSSFLSTSVSFQDQGYLGSFIEKIVGQHGILDFSKDMKGLGKSTRQIERQFKSSIGLTPQRFCRILRFKKAVRLLASTNNHVHIALACGYYDQSHMIRDFKDLAGKTPSYYSTS